MVLWHRCGRDEADRGPHDRRDDLVPEALDRVCGLVPEGVADRDRLDETALALAHEIAANAPLAVQGIKRTINGFVERGFTEALRFEAMSAAVEFVSDDMTIGYAAKAKREAAEFEGK